MRSGHFWEGKGQKKEEMKYRSSTEIQEQKYTLYPNYHSWTSEHYGGCLVTDLNRAIGQAGVTHGIRGRIFSA